MWSEIGVVPNDAVRRVKWKIFVVKDKPRRNQARRKQRVLWPELTRLLLLFRAINLKSADQTEEPRRCEADQTQQPNLHELSDCSCRFNPSDGKSGFKWFNLFATECSPRRSGGQVKYCRASCSVNSTTNSSISSQWRGYRRLLEFGERRATEVQGFAQDFELLNNLQVCRSDIVT